MVMPGAAGTGVVVEARDVGRTLRANQDTSDPLVVTVQNTLARLGVTDPGDLYLTIASDIPVASGLGSGAAVAVATIRALNAWLDGHLTDADVSALAY
ncbi:MAG: mevalonate kinase, partial [Chloroflexi bacterium]|nr:mevalonate kinase [Chloroflexota bacterium]